MLDGGDNRILESIQLLFDAWRGALRARDFSGKSPIMSAFADRRFLASSPLSLKVQKLLQEMVEREPTGIRQLFFQGQVRTTVLEKLCELGAGPELIGAVVEAWPSVLWFSFLRPGTQLPEEVGRARHAFLLALTEVLLHETTLGVVPNSIREHVRQAVGQFAPPDEMRGPSVAVVRAIQNHVADRDRERLRMAVLGSENLQAFVRDGEALQGFVAGVYRMNRAGRILSGSASGGVASEAALSPERHARVLAAARGDASSLFLRLRECPAAAAAAGGMLRAPRAAGADGFRRGGA
jgi:hypothetical protein